MLLACRLLAALPKQMERVYTNSQTNIWPRISMLWDTVRASANPFESQNIIDECEAKEAELVKARKARDRWASIVETKERDAPRLLDSSLLVLETLAS